MTGLDERHGYTVVAHWVIEANTPYRYLTAEVYGYPFALAVEQPHGPYWTLSLAQTLGFRSPGDPLARVDTEVSARRWLDLLARLYMSLPHNAALPGALSWSAAEDRR